MKACGTDGERIAEITPDHAFCFSWRKEKLKKEKQGRSERTGLDQTICPARQEDDELGANTPTPTHAAHILTMIRVGAQHQGESENTDVVDMRACVQPGTKRNETKS